MHRILAWTAFLLPVAIALGCSDDDQNGESDGGCGVDECSSLEEGEWQVSGDPRLDGLFRAAVMIDERLRDNEARTREAVARLAEAFDVEIDPTDDLDDNATIVAGALQGVFEDFVGYAAWDAGPCIADVPFAYEAEVACEIHFGCEASYEAATGGVAPAPVGCEGECRGACDGACSGACLTPVDAAACGGACYGACDLSISGGACEGTCHGECSGACPVYNGETGQCMGPCSGTCTGVCETLHEGTACPGTCTGECGVEIFIDEMCMGACRGTCDGTCTGECSGPATPASGNAMAECDMTSACQPVASLLSWAAPSPTWVERLVVWYPNPDLASWTAPELAAAFAVLEDELPALIASNAELKAIVVGDDAYAVTSIGGIQEAIDNLIGGGLDALDLSAETEDCVIAAFEGVAEFLVDIPMRAVPVVMAQTELLAVIAAD